MDGNFDLNEWKSRLEGLVNFYAQQSNTAGSPLDKLESAGIDVYQASLMGSDLLKMKKEISKLIRDVKSSCLKNKIAEKHLREELGWLNIKASEALERIDMIDKKFKLSKKGRNQKPLMIAQAFLQGLEWAKGDATRIKLIQEVLHPTCSEIEKIPDLGFISTASIPDPSTNDSIEWARKLRKNCREIQKKELKLINERED